MWLRAVQARVEDAEFEYDKTRAGLEEADMVKAIMDYQRDQYVYQATLNVGARSFSPTLLDFLR
jgi:flagellin-like hook-associated protein FlgL